jgi:hypothetical protein
MEISNINHATFSCPFIVVNIAMQSMIGYKNIKIARKAVHCTIGGHWNFLLQNPDSFGTKKIYVRKSPPAPALAYNLRNEIFFKIPPARPLASSDLAA